MEKFAVASFRALVTVVLAKLCLVEKDDAVIISTSLSTIMCHLDKYASQGETFTWIAECRNLAYQIEDCIDRFHANKPTASGKKVFTEQIAIFRKQSVDLRANMGAADTVEGTEGSGVQRQDPATDNSLVYLYLFPRTHPVRTKPLIRRWLAEELVQREDLAVDKFRLFIDSGYINSTQRSNNGNVKRCKPSPQTFETNAEMSKSGKFVLVCDRKTQPWNVELRRLSVHPCTDMQLNLPQRLPRLRTLAVFPHGEANLASYEDVLNFARYDVLRVLDLKECAHLSDGHIQAICKQVLMKYLSINLGSIGPIPSEIASLNQLETLELSNTEGSEAVTVHEEVLLMPKLKHLLGKFQLLTSDKAILRWIPSDLKNFLQNKSVLETLKGFVTGDREGFAQLMSLMKSLRKVKIWCKPEASRKNQLALSKAITNFIRAGTDQPDLCRSLSIHFEDGCGEFANEIEAVAGNLDSLKLRGKLSQFPPFVSKLRGVVELCLRSTGLRWEVIRAGLRGVTGLKFLKLTEDNLECFDIISGTAKQLRSVERICVLCECKEGLEVAITAAPLPNLVSVQIICNNVHLIHNLPDIEIAHMRNLKEVAFHRQFKEAREDQLLQISKAHPNRPDILFLEYP